MLNCEKVLKTTKNIQTKTEKLMKLEKTETVI